MPRFRNTVSGSVVNIDDGLATRLAITENPAWEPLDEHSYPATTEAAPQVTAAELMSLSDRVASQTFAAIVPEDTDAAPAEPKAPTKGKPARKPSPTDPEGAKDASGSD